MDYAEKQALRANVTHQMRQLADVHARQAALFEELRVALARDVLQALCAESPAWSFIVAGTPHDLRHLGEVYPSPHGRIVASFILVHDEEGDAEYVHVVLRAGGGLFFDDGAALPETSAEAWAAVEAHRPKK